MATIEKYLDFSKEELEKEIENQKERIKRSRKLIKFLQRLLAINGATSNKNDEYESIEYEDPAEDVTDDEEADDGGSGKDKSDWRSGLSST